MLAGMIDVGAYRVELDHAAELAKECHRATSAVCRLVGVRVADMYPRYAMMWLAYDRAQTWLRHSWTAWERAKRSGWQGSTLVSVGNYTYIAQSQAQDAIDIAREIVDYVGGGG